MNISSINVKSAYRSDIDGLRGLAILGVLFFHLGVSSFAGGWIGVDIFFVISGFLITQKIHSSINGGSFSLPTFFASRAKRLFPSYITVIFITFVAAYLIFDRAYLKNVGGEVFASSLGLANLYFWREGNYFNLSSHLRPLLHLWSLGVEMQFYLVWPLILILTARYFKNHLVMIVLTLFITSILLAEYFSGIKNDTSFFLPQFRIFEFMMGALLASVINIPKPPNWLSALLQLLGLLLIVYAIVFFNDQMPYPSFQALIPCLGAFLLLYTQCNQWPGLVINNRVISFIGKISYCLYLVHWPIIIFFLYQRVEPLDPLVRLIIVALSFSAAMALHYFVEIPIWKGKRFSTLSNQSVGLICCALMLVVMVPAAIVWTKGGLSWKGSDLELDPVETSIFLERKLRDQQNKQLNTHQFGEDPKKEKWLFLGDSHSPDLGAAFLENINLQKNEIATLGFDDECFTTAIFIANYWRPKSLKGFEDGIAFLQANTKAKIYIVGQNTVFPEYEPSLRYLSEGRKKALNSFFYEHQSKQDIAVNDQLELLAKNNGLAFIDRQSIVCSKDEHQCAIFDNEGQAYYLDSTHWTPKGRALFGITLVQRYLAIKPH
jgi:peptidoglycan/LPS O-acetylase OafA/YrhL